MNRTGCSPQQQHLRAAAAAPERRQLGGGRYPQGGNLQADPGLGHVEADDLPPAKPDFAAVQLALARRQLSGPGPGDPGEVATGPGRRLEVVDG